MVALLTNSQGWLHWVLRNGLIMIASVYDCSKGSDYTFSLSTWKVTTWHRIVGFLRNCGTWIELGPWWVATVEVTRVQAGFVVADSGWIRISECGIPVRKQPYFHDILLLYDSATLLAVNKAVLWAELHFQQSVCTAFIVNCSNCKWESIWIHKWEIQHVERTVR